MTDDVSALARRIIEAADKATPGPWVAGPLNSEYCVAYRKPGLPLEKMRFEAASIGTSNHASGKQIALVPLDESTMECLYHIVACSPERAKAVAQRALECDELAKQLDWCCEKCREVFPRDSIPNKISATICPKCGGIRASLPTIEIMAANRRAEAAEQALEELVAVKDLKDHEGKTEEYRERQPKAWAAARAVLAKHGKGRGA